MKKRKLLSFLIPLVAITAIGSIASSIAWFRSGAKVQISDINFEFLTGNPDLKISTQTELSTFKTSIPYNELDIVDGFVPISSMFSNEWVEAKESFPRFKANPTAGGENPIVYDARGGYYTQAFYFYSERSIYATIDATVSTLSYDLEENSITAAEILPQYPEETFDSLLAKLNKIKNTLRFSILVPEKEKYQFSIIDPFKDRTTLLAGVLDTDSNGYFDYYSKNGKKYETVYGQVTDRSKLVYNDPVPYDTESESIFVAKHHANVYTLNLEKSIENGAGFAIENSITLSESENVVKIPVHAYEPSKFFVSIYLEGWDIDTINSTMFASFLAKIQFKILREMY